MSSPRNLYPDTTLYITVRCVHRSYRLVPKKRVNRVVRFAFAAVSSRYREKFGMEFYEFVFLSTHYHIVLFDRFGHVSDFLKDFNAVVARELNAIRGTGGKFFADGPGIQTVLGEETTGQATMTLAWLDLDDGDRESAKARFSAARVFLARPLDQAWAEFGGTVASVGANGQASLEERALAERALDRFSARAPSHRFEVDAIERWLASHEPSEVTAPDRLDLQDPVRGTPRHDARP